MWLLHVRLQKSQPYVAVETSTSRASMQDKNDALSCADLVVLFVGDAYYNSHEMQTEYISSIRKRGKYISTWDGDVLSYMDVCVCACVCVCVCVSVCVFV